MNNNEKCASVFRMNTRLRQGDCLSSTSFSGLLNDIFKAMENIYIVEKIYCHVKICVLCSVDTNR